MKNINDIIYESLLGGEREIEEKTLNAAGRAMVDNFYGDVKMSGYLPKDILGRDLHEGDLVICKHVGCCALGIIEKINGGKCAVYIGVPNKNRTASGEIPTRDNCKEMIKITPEIAQLIMGVK